MDYDSYRDRFQRLNEATDYIPSGLLCHYTSLSGLKGIMSSKKLWFSDSACLNDKTEGKYIYDVLKDCLFDIKNKKSVQRRTINALYARLPKITKRRVILTRVTTLFAKIIRHSART